jgi:hypothetical protein
MNERNRDKNRIRIRIRECWYSEGKETEREAVAEPRRAVYMRG